MSASAAPAHGSPVKQRALARVRGLLRQREQLYSPQHDKIKRWQEEHDPARKKVKLMEEEKQAKKAANATRAAEASARRGWNLVSDPSANRVASRELLCVVARRTLRLVYSRIVIPHPTIVVVE